MNYKLQQKLQTRFANIEGFSFAYSYDEITMLLPRSQILQTASVLIEEHDFAFEQLIDLCGVDYLYYGTSNWNTTTASSVGFSRGVEPNKTVATQHPSRFAVVYHLLSYKHNHRLRLRCYLNSTQPRIDSVISIWQSANWYEREAFDLLGICFDNHPDLRRLLTDYGFIGHPLRKDFPLTGEVEVRYDAKEGRVVYEPCSITNRTLVPKVIRT